MHSAGFFATFLAREKSREQLYFITLLSKPFK